MPEIRVSDEVYERLVFAAGVSGLTVSEVVERLASAGRQGAPEQAASADDQMRSPSDEASRQKLDVIADYRGVRATGVYDVLTGSLAVVTGPAAARTYKSASAAAVAVTMAANPARRHPNTNGKHFWRVVPDGLPLAAWLDGHRAE